MAGMILAAAYMTKTRYIKLMMTEGVIVWMTAQTKLKLACAAVGKLER
jgi:hypothetical protein